MLQKILLIAVLFHSITKMIEVTAKLGRGSVYFAGEKLSCTLRFHNIADVENQSRLVLEKVFIGHKVCLQ